MSPIQWPGKIVMPMGGADREDFAKRWEETFAPRARVATCRCRCPEGECEHKWDGMWWDAEDGRSCSVTCSICGAIRMNHDMRVGL